jgi:hypothetical protein
MSEPDEPEKVYEDGAVVLYRGFDDRGWLYVAQVYFPLPRYDNNVKHRISLSPTGKTVELLKAWDGWSMGGGGLAGSTSIKLRLGETEGAALKKKLENLASAEEFQELWASLWWRD